MDKTAYEVVFCIVNAGYSEQVMDAAREAGVSGGTVLRAQGTANKEAEMLFNITIQPDKEVVVMLVPKSIKDKVLHVLYQTVGLETPGSGIAFSLPVDGVAGLGRKSKVEKPHKKEDPDAAPPAPESETTEKKEE